MHQSVKLTDAMWLLQLVISSPLIRAMGELSQSPTKIRTWEADNLPIELSLPSFGLKTMKWNNTSW